MSYWDGTRWLPQDDPSATRPASGRIGARDWLATMLMIIGLVAMILPLSSIAARSRSTEG